MFEYSSILNILIGLPIIGIGILLFIPNTSADLQKSIGLTTTLLTFVLSLLLWLNFDISTPKYQFVEKFFSVPYSNLHIYVGVDGISLFLCC
jgi:NADH-quinone oxidoreductase subunit M